MHLLGCCKVREAKRNLEEAEARYYDELAEAQHIAEIAQKATQRKQRLCYMRSLCDVPACTQTVSLCMYSPRLDRHCTRDLVRDLATAINLGRKWRRP